MRSIKSAERTLALFELFSAREERLKVGDVAASLGIPQPSTSMLLRNLVDLGYLDFDARARSFGPTIRVMLLGCWMTRRFSEADGLSSSLSELYDRSGGETSFVAMQHGTTVRYIAAIQADRPNRLTVRAGHMDSLTCSAAGRILLSLMTDKEVQGWITRCNSEAVADNYRVSYQEFLDTIKRARLAGFAATHGDLWPGHGAIAVAVPSPLGNVSLAIGVGGALERIAPKNDSLLEILVNIKARLTGTAKPGDFIAGTS